MAIILAACDPRINLLGVSTSPGNSTLDNTTRNALDILYNIGKNDVPVIMGSPKPFSQTIVYGSHMHGGNGLGGLEIPHTSKKAITEDRFSAIYKLIMKAEGKVCFVNTGSLTNLAILLASHPDLKDKLQEISIMGGAIGEGNITPAAEFNIFFDSVAAQECLSYGIPFTMVPLEVTHQVRANQKVMDKLAEHKSEVGKTLLQLLQVYQQNYFNTYKFQFAPIHDPVAVFYLLER